MKAILGVITAVYLMAIAAPAVMAGGKVFERQTFAEPGNGWKVDYVPELNTCTVGRMHDNGVSLQIFYNREDRSFTMMLLNNKWQQVEDGAAYTLNLVMDNGADSWRGQAHGIWTNDGSPGFTMVSLKTTFLQSFMARNRIDFYNANNNARITALLLDGSTNAMTAEIACLDAHGGPNAPSAPTGRSQTAPGFQS